MNQTAYGKAWKILVNPNGGVTHKVGWVFIKSGEIRQERLVSNAMGGRCSRPHFWLVVNSLLTATNTVGPIIVNQKGQLLYVHVTSHNNVPMLYFFSKIHPYPSIFREEKSVSIRLKIACIKNVHVHLASPRHIGITELKCLHITCVIPLVNRDRSVKMATSRGGQISLTSQHGKKNGLLTPGGKFGWGDSQVSESQLRALIVVILEAN